MANALSELTLKQSSSLIKNDCKKQSNIGDCFIEEAVLTVQNDRWENRSENEIFVSQYLLGTVP